MAASHDNLLADMHTWLWNTHPETRGLYHANFNNLPLALESMLPLPLKMRLMGVMKHIGAVKGVMDAELFWSGRLYFFDAKIGTDKLSKDQLDVGSALFSQGGAFTSIRSLEQFQTEIKNILEHGCLTTEA